MSPDWLFLLFAIIFMAVSVLYRIKPKWFKNRFKKKVDRKIETKEERPEHTKNGSVLIGEGTTPKLEKKPKSSHDNFWVIGGSICFLVVLITFAIFEDVVFSIVALFVTIIFLINFYYFSESSPAPSYAGMGEEGISVNKEITQNDTKPVTHFRNYDTEIIGFYRKAYQKCFEFSSRIQRNFFVVSLLGVIVFIITVVILENVACGICSASTTFIFLFIILLKPELIETFFIGTYDRSHNLSEKGEREPHINQQEWEKCRMFLSTDNHKYLTNYVKKYGRGYYYFPPQNRYVLESQTQRLKELVATKGFMFTDREICWLLYVEEKRLKYENFKTKLSYYNPKSIRDYIRSFIEIHGENYRKYIEFLEDVVSEKGLKIERSLLLKTVETTKKKMELIHFEKKLTPLRMKDIDQFDGQKFESFLAELFEGMGYRVEHTKLSGDQGADLVISKFGEKVVVQAKRYGGSVSNKAVQEVVAAIGYYKADRGMVVTNSMFTQSATELARANDIELIDRDKLEKLTNKYL